MIMKYAVRYYSRSGNTKKLADAAAEVLGVQAECVSEPLKEDVDVLFLGASIYWAGIDKQVKKFLEAPGAKIGSVIILSTAALMESGYSQIRSAAEKQGLKVDDREYHCAGSFKALHAGKPDEDDIAKLRHFVTEVVR